MALYLVSSGNTIQAADVDQLVKLLNGTTTDTAVTVSNRIQAELAGATAASGYVSGTASGAPSSGTFAVGDFVIDHTGVIWICTAAGTPGTWASVGTSPIVVSATGTYTASANDYVLANAAGGAFTITLPAAVLDLVVAVKKTDLSQNVVTVAPASGNVDGETTYALTQANQAALFVSDGTNWWVF